MAGVGIVRLVLDRGFGSRCVPESHEHTTLTVVATFMHPHATILVNCSWCGSATGLVIRTLAIIRFLSVLPFSIQVQVIRRQRRVSVALFHVIKGICAIKCLQRVRIPRRCMDIERMPTGTREVQVTIKACHRFNPTDPMPKNGKQVSQT